MSRDFVGTSYHDPVVWFHAVIATINPLSVHIFPNARMGALSARAGVRALAAAAVGVRRGVSVSIYAIIPCTAAEAAIAQQLARAAGI